jgi:hypothetical protein
MERRKLKENAGALQRLKLRLSIVFPLSRDTQGIRRLLGTQLTLPARSPGQPVANNESPTGTVPQDCNFYYLKFKLILFIIFDFYIKF